MASHDIFYYTLPEMRTGPTKWIRNGADSGDHRLIKQLDDPSYNVVLGSDENILGWPKELLTGSLYTQARKRLLYIAKAFPDKEIQIIVTVRNLRVFLVSLYCEYIRNNGFIHFSEYVKNVDLNRFSYARMFGWIEELPQNAQVSFVPVDDVNRDIGTVLQLIDDLSGYKRKNSVAMSTHNKKRYTYNSTEIKCLEALSHVTSKERTRWFISVYESLGMRAPGSVYDPLSQAESAKLDRQYKSDLASFSGAGVLVTGRIQPAGAELGVTNQYAKN